VTAFARFAGAVLLGLGLLASGPGTVTAAEPPTPCDEEILVSLYTAGDVMRVDACDGTLLGALDDGGRLAGAQTLRTGPDGLLYVVSEENHRILRFDGETLAFVDVWLEDARLEKPTALDFGPDGAAYIGSYAGGRVWRYADGELTVFLEDEALAGIDAGMAFDAVGDLWVPAFDGHVVFVVDGATAEVRRRITDGLESPRMLLWEPGGRAVLIGSWANDRILRLAPGDAEAEPALLFERARPSGLARLADGRLLTVSDVGGPIYAVTIGADGEVAAEEIARDEALAAMTYLLVRPAAAPAAP
jgi:sugar lactone lactonase YvrE